MNLHELESALTSLPDGDLAAFTNAWARRIEADFRAGRLDDAGRRADADFEAGRCTPL